MGYYLKAVLLSNSCSFISFKQPENSRLLGVTRLKAAVPVHLCLRIKRMRARLYIKLLKRTSVYQSKCRVFRLCTTHFTLNRYSAARPYHIYSTSQTKPSFKLFVDVILVTSSRKLSTNEKYIDPRS